MTQLPTIPNDIIWQLLEIVEAVKKEPELADSLSYPHDFLKLLKTLGNVNKVANKTLEDLETEIASLYTELDDFKNIIPEGDNDATIAYLKLKAVLITKLVDLQERTYNLKRQKQFESTLLAAIDVCMNAEDRTKLMRYLDEH